LKICILTTSFPRYQGDYAGSFVHDLGRWLARNGASVQVVAPHAAGLPIRETMSGIDVYRFAYIIPRRWQKIAYQGGIPNNLRRYRMAWVQLPLLLLGFVAAGLRVCGECDIYHAYWVFAGFAAALLSRITSKSSVLTVQGSDINLSFGNPLLRAFRSYVVRRMDRMIAVSTPLAARVQSLMAMPEKVVVIPNGVDTSRFVASSAGLPWRYRLLWIGRFSPEKGLEHLIRAMPDILVQFPETSLTLIGDGPLRPAVEQQVVEMGLEKEIHFTGIVPHDDIPSHLADCDVFALPSLSEGLPLVLVEAMSAGKPAVATNVGGIPDVVVAEGEGQTGYLVPAGDHQALARAIAQLISDPASAKRMGERARTRVEEHFSWPRIADQTLALYRSLG